jgi:hypothetical protein
MGKSNDTSRSDILTCLQGSPRNHARQLSCRCLWDQSLLMGEALENVVLHQGNEVVPPSAH